MGKSKQDLKYIAQWKKENYKTIRLFIRGDENQDLIDWIDEQKEWGYSNNELVRTALWDYYKTKVKNNG